MTKTDSKSCNKCLEIGLKGRIIDKSDETAEMLNDYKFPSIQFRIL